MNEQALYGQIDGIGIPVSRVFFGTAMAPVNTDAPEAQVLLDRVLETGVNAFDCARSYGLAEQALGRWIRECGVRDRIVLLTKGGDIREGKVCVNRQVITGQLEESLRTLRTDHIDLYLLHRDDPATVKTEKVYRLFGDIVYRSPPCETAQTTVEFAAYGRWRADSPLGFRQQMWQHLSRIAAGEA